VVVEVVWLTRLAVSSGEASVRVAAQALVWVDVQASALVVVLV
jgi:hypothetical protein